MSSYNPTAALSAINPSLIGYMGGYGKAMQSIGGSLTQVGQAKLDLEQKDVDNKKAQAYLDLQRQNTQLGLDNASYVKKKDFETRNDKFTSNANTNALILGEDAPVEMSNRYAQLSNIDPAVMTAMAKTDKDKYTIGANGLVINTSTGALAGDYRDKDGNLKNTPFLDSIVDGKKTRTYFSDDGKPKLQITAPGTPENVYGQYVADGIGDNNVDQRPKIKDNVNQKITAQNYINKGYMPIRYPADPKVAARMRERYANRFEGISGDFVHPNFIKDFMHEFPQ